MQLAPSTMRIVGVIDVRRGQAVHARAGLRSAYEPIRSAAGVAVDGDPVALVRVYADILGVRELYLADLDAIDAGIAALDRRVVSQIASLGRPLLLDAGVSTPADARAVLEAGASTVVVGLETLTGFPALADICRDAGRDRVAFSLDLRDGVPVALPNVIDAAWSAADVARRAADAGVGTIIVLDLARVGTGTGIDGERMGAVRRAVPGVNLLAGGGVRSAADLDELSSAGCDGALVATALLSGALQV